MKKLRVLVAVVIAGFLVTGCLGVRTYSDSGEAISIRVKQDFIIALGSNPTTGYGWEESYDKTMLELVRKTYELGEQVEEGGDGAGGVDYFRFRALKTGQTRITMYYQRSWEKESIEQQVFTVNIK